MTKTDASAEASTKGRLVMATAAISGGAAGVFAKLLDVSGLTSLTVGATYYLSTTAGAITTTAPVITVGSGHSFQIIQPNSVAQMMPL